jgi:hypothetical protein
VSIIQTSSLHCSIHRAHHPSPLYTEIHHIIPRAWQAAWQPAGASAGKLWANETVPLCRTAHGNVHWILVAAMRAYQRSASDAPNRIDAAIHVALRELDVSAHVREMKVARDAMVRFSGAGGSLDALCEKGFYGEI